MGTIPTAVPVLPSSEQVPRGLPTKQEPMSTMTDKPRHPQPVRLQDGEQGHPMRQAWATVADGYRAALGTPGARA